MSSTELFVFNGNPRLTGVSSTIANLYPLQAEKFTANLVGNDLPGCPPAIDLGAARRLSRKPPKGLPFAIWHLRRDPDMRAGIWARDVLRLPIRLVFTSSAQRRHSAIPRWLISRMDAVIATTQRAAGFLEQEPAAIIAHGIPTNRFTPAPDRAQAWRELGYGGQRGIATVGRIRPDKGTDHFIDAVIPVLRAHHDLVALVIGLAKPADREFCEKIQAKLVRAGLKDRVHFTGVIDNYEQLPKILRAASVVVCLPRHEEFGIVPLESMASGTAFVASDTGAYRTLTNGQTTGQIVPVGDSSRAAQLVSRLLQHPDLARQMGQRGREFVKAHYDIAGEAEALAEVYRDLWQRG